MISVDVKHHVYFLNPRVLLPIPAMNTADDPTIRGLMMSRGKERVRTEESSLETTEAAQTGTEELYQRQRGSRWELFCQY